MILIKIKLDRMIKKRKHELDGKKWGEMDNKRETL